MSRLLLLFAAGVWLYSSTTRAKNAVGHWSFLALAVFLLIVYIASVASGPPPSVAAVCWAGLVGGFAIVGWSWWTDRHRQAV